MLIHEGVYYIIRPIIVITDIIYGNYYNKRKLFSIGHQCFDKVSFAVAMVWIDGETITKVLYCNHVALRVCPSVHC